MELEEFDLWVLLEFKDIGIFWNGMYLCIYNNYGI